MRVQIVEVLIVHFFAHSCCVLHCGDGSSDGTIVPFVDHTPGKCRTVLSIRKARNLKCKELLLPENVYNNKTGYHAECYRKFTALGRNASPKNTMLNQNQHIQNQKLLWQVVHHQ